MQYVTRILARNSAPFRVGRGVHQVERGLNRLSSHRRAIMAGMPTLHEPARETPVWHECDVCVIGGSCTGVFAAIRAARMGAKVVLVERGGAFGGVATLSLVNVWHSPLDTVFEKPIIGGLTLELMNRLKSRNVVTEQERSPAWAWAFNPYEMMLALDQLVLEHQIKPLLHSMVVQPLVEGDRVTAVVVENKSGRGAIRARYFIDASGDGDVAHRAGSACYYAEHLQPSTTCAIMEGWDSIKPADIGALIRDHRAEYDLPLGFAWGANLPQSQLYMLAGTRVQGLDPSNGDELTQSEIEGRRQVRAFLDIIKKYVPQAKVNLVGLPARIGLRESRHVKCQYQLTGNDVLHGKRFDDAIANGSYRVDIHHSDKPGLTFQYLDGTASYLVPGEPAVQGRWREPIENDPTFYQIPYRSMLPGTFANLLIAGRMIDADTPAHAAIRVMVNMNQTGEAAGVASVLAMRSTNDVRTIDIPALRNTLADGGSIII